MGTEIYSATTLQVFFEDLFWGFAAIIVVPIIGLSALIYGNSKRKEKDHRWILAAALGVFFLLLIPLLWKPLTGLWSTMNAEPRIITTRVDQMNTVDADNNCTGYALEATIGDEAVVIFVKERAYEQIRVGACYKFTYYTLYRPPQGSVPQWVTSYYIYSDWTSICHVSHIEVSDHSDCP
jgi:hypothetical protein